MIEGGALLSMITEMADEIQLEGLIEVRPGFQIVSENEFHPYCGGINPEKNRNNLTGLGYIPIIEEKIGRKTTGEEWANMSIR